MTTPKPTATPNHTNVTTLLKPLEEQKLHETTTSSSNTTPSKQSPVFIPPTQATPTHITKSVLKPLNNNNSNDSTDTTSIKQRNLSTNSDNGTTPANKPGQTIISKINKLQADGKIFYSFEYFPPKTREGVTNLYDRLDRMSLLEPMFMDVTWGAGGSTSELTLEISASTQAMGNEVMMHLTCTNMPVVSIKSALERAKAAGIRNILALRGDPPKGAESWEQCEEGFAHAVDLVRYIRQEYGDFFGIGVAGYPEGHIQSANVQADIHALKQKVDAGADFVITQLFYDTKLFIRWMKECQAQGINVPIIPGIMPIQNYNGFKRMTSFCATYVPDHITDAIEPIKEDDSAVKQYGIDLAVQMCQELLAAGVPGLHFYTLNLEKSVTNILEGLGFVVPQATLRDRLPWKQSLVARRAKEEVRPIFWANRPKSYLDRTIHWDEYPNGRWGDSASPAYGSLDDYHLVGFRSGSTDERKQLWGNDPKSAKDVYEVFAQYIEGSVPRLPWCDNSIQLETLPIKAQLARMNRHGFLTINSQPRVNGAMSTDPAVGWGGAGGFVYQKAYLEFFCSKKLLDKLAAVAVNYPSLTYTAVNVNGDVVTSLADSERGAVNAVTWGVFPNREVLQPTVVELGSFMAWKDEAFALWISQWRVLYQEGSQAYKTIQEIRDTYYLVNVVDNDFINGDLFALFDTLLQ